MRCVEGGRGLAKSPILGKRFYREPTDIASLNTGGRPVTSNEPLSADTTVFITWLEFIDAMDIGRLETALPLKSTIFPVISGRGGKAAKVSSMHTTSFISNTAVRKSPRHRTRRANRRLRSAATQPALPQRRSCITRSGHSSHFSFCHCSPHKDRIRASGRSHDNRERGGITGKMYLSEQFAVRIRVHP
jgi:hypothetical protein